MNLTTVPKLCKETLCIAGNPIVAAVISSYFNEEGQYFCVLEPPRMGRPDYSDEITRRNNVAAILKPQRIILAELEEKAFLGLQRCFPPEMTTIIRSLSELEDGLGEIKTSHFDGEIFCNPKEISYGLLLAKTLKMKLTVDVSAPFLEEKFRELFYRSDHLIAVEDSDDFAPIIAANYAFSLNANLKLIPKVTDQDVDKVYNELMDRQVFRLSPRGERAEIYLTERSVKYHAQMPLCNLVLLPL
jgi:hypothetical protein